MNDESFEFELEERAPRGRKRRSLETEEQEQDAARRPRERPTAAGEDQHAPIGRIAQLQRRYGNAGLLQLRALQRQRTFSGAETPEWMKQEVGITPQSEANFREAETATTAAEELSVPMGGAPLSREVREPAERAFGVGLGDVNVVERGDSATTPLQAHAFAAQNEGGGHSVVLSSGVDLGSGEGQFTLMHELAHVAQQKKGEADSLEGLGGDESVREQLELKADDDAQRLLSRPD
jgi:hypothetical protein